MAMMKPAAHRSAASLGLAALERELGDTARPRVVRELTDDDVLRQEPPEAFAPKRQLPDYVQHSHDATQIGKMSAHAVVLEFEQTAKEIESLGDELRAMEGKAKEAQAAMAKALGDLTSTVAAYREEAARLFKHVEDVTTTASEASALAAQLRERIAGGA